MKTVLLATGLVLVAVAAFGQPGDLDDIARKVGTGQLETAEGELRRLLADTESARARDLLGVVLIRQGRIGEAEPEFRRAVELSPDFLPARLNLGRLYLQQRRADEALAELQAAAKLGPLGRDLAFQLAVLELDAGQTAAAEGRLLALATELDSVRALLRLARSMARRGESQAALEHLERALALAPNSEEVLSAHARLLLALRAPAVAIETLGALRRMHPSVGTYPYLLGVAELQIAEAGAAVESLSRAVELEPRQAVAWIALGLAHNTLKQLPEAKNALSRALQLVPGNVDALVALAEAEHGLGELEAAERHLQRSLEIAGEAAGALYVLGKIRMAQNRYDEARDVLARAVQEDPTMARAHYQLSLAYARLGDRESSRAHRELYRQTQAEQEERVIELRTSAGLGISGMRGGG